MKRENEMFENYEVSENIVALIPARPINEINDASETVSITCIAFPNELIFVDCGSYPDLAKKFRSEMENRFQRKTSHLLLTHSHWDHIIGMEAFKDVNVVISKAGIQGISNVINRISGKNLEECQRDFAVQEELAEIFLNAELFIPNTIVKDQFRIDSDGIELIFQVIGGHSIDSAHVYVPTEQLLCAGDNLIECYAQRPGNPDDMLKVFNNWESLEVSNAIPGHGRPVGKEYMMKVKKYYEDLIFKLEEFNAQKLSIKEVLTHADLPEYFGKNQLNWMEGIKPDSKWIETMIRGWYRYIKRRAKSKNK